MLTIYFSSVGVKMCFMVLCEMLKIKKQKLIVIIANYNLFNSVLLVVV